jgi:hypothetical protein
VIFNVWLRLSKDEASIWGNGVGYVRLEPVQIGLPSWCMIRGRAANPV